MIEFEKRAGVRKVIIGHLESSGKRKEKKAEAEEKVAEGEE